MTAQERPTCAGCSTPLREAYGLRTCDTAECPGNLAPLPAQPEEQRITRPHPFAAAHRKALFLSMALAGGASLTGWLIAWLVTR